MAEQIDQGGIPKPERGGFKPVVLVVEDDPILRRLEERTLIELGVEHSLAQDVAQARKILEENPGKFSHIFSDFDMPGVSGGEFAEEVRGKFSNLSITLMTGRPSDDDSLEGLKDKGVSFIQKPFSISDVEKLLTEESKTK